MEYSLFSSVLCGNMKPLYSFLHCQQICGQMDEFLAGQRDSRAAELGMARPACSSCTIRKQDVVKKIRVCCFCERWESGGIESFLNNLLRHMGISHMEVDLVAAELKEKMCIRDSDEVTVKRKILEIFLALEFELNYSKEEILEMYLNYIYLGESCYGVGTASYTYFGKPVSELTLAAVSYTHLYTTVIQSRKPDLVATEVARLAGEYGVEELVMGFPRNMDGTEGPRAERYRGFAERLREATGLGPVLWDERRTTIAAHDLLHPCLLYNSPTW